MRVLMTADTVGGVWTYAIELIRALPQVDFLLATMGKLPDEAQRAEIPPNAKLAASSFRLEWMELPWNDVANAGHWLLDLEEEWKPDVVHLNGYTHAAWPFSAPKLVVAHSCVLSWWQAVHGEPAPPKEWLRYHDNVERGLQSASMVIAPSKAMLDALRPHYSFETPARVIHNGRSDESTRQPAATPRSAPREIVFAAGRLWDEAKNLAAVVRAAPQIAWPVHIAGEGGADAPNVTHHGRLDREAMQQRYAEAGIYLFPALYEPFGLSILEAALAGCALVIGDIASLREIWGDAAVYVPPRDAAAIADAVNGLIGDRGRREEMALRARQRAAKYTPDLMARNYSEVYASLKGTRREEGAVRTLLPLAHL